MSYRYEDFEEWLATPEGIKATAEQVARGAYDVALEWMSREMPPSEHLHSLAALIRAERKAAVAAVEQAVVDALVAAKPHTLASENADIYIAYEDGAEMVAARVRRALTDASGEG